MISVVRKGDTSRPGQGVKLYAYDGLKARRDHRGPRRRDRHRWPAWTRSASATPSPPSRRRRRYKRIEVDEPTIVDDLSSGSTDGPFAGREGKKYVTSRNLRERPVPRGLQERGHPRGGDRDARRPQGRRPRRELQLAVIVEDDAPEGYELTVSNPER
jgi:hypothetical protein